MNQDTCGWNFSSFEIFNNVKKSSSELRPEIFSFENKTALAEVFEHFYDEKEYRKSFSFMLLLKLELFTFTNLTEVTNDCK